MSDLLCWNCGASLDDVPRPISRHATCSKCFNELHCCRLCRHFDASRTMQCFEDRADPPLQKENANFCEFFIPTSDAYKEGTNSKSTGAKEKLDALFGNTESADNSMGDDAVSDEAMAAEAKTDEAKPEVLKPDKEHLSPEESARKKLDDLFN